MDSQNAYGTLMTAEYVVIMRYADRTEEWDCDGVVLDGKLVFDRDFERFLALLEDIPGATAPGPGQAMPVSQYPAQAQPDWRQLFSRRRQLFLPFTPGIA